MCRCRGCRRRESRGRRRWRYVSFFHFSLPYLFRHFSFFLFSFFLFLVLFLFYLLELTPGLPQTYTLEFTRANQPQRGHIVGRLKSNGARFIANHADARTLAELGSWEREPIGRSGYVRRSEDGRNVFSLFGDGGGTRGSGKL